MEAVMSKRAELKKIVEENEQKVNKLQSEIHDCSFSALREAFLKYDIVEKDGTTKVIDRADGTEVSDEHIINMTKYANIWFYQATARESSEYADIRDKRRDERLVEMAFGASQGEKTFNIMQNCYYAAWDAWLSAPEPKPEYENVLKDNFKKVMPSVDSFGTPILESLAFGEDERACSDDYYKPEFFQMETFNFMKESYSNKQKKKALIQGVNEYEKAKEALATTGLSGKVRSIYRKIKEVISSIFKKQTSKAAEKEKTM